MQVLTTTVARILFAVSISLLGLLSIIEMGYRPVPDQIVGLISGIVFIAAGISIFIQRKARLASFLLVAMFSLIILVTLLRYINIL